jgi:hypothetical protein
MSLDVFPCEMYVYLNERRIPFISSTYNKNVNIWNFWKFKKISQVELNNFICNSRYVFWICCYGHSFATPYFLPPSILHNAHKNKFVWITICYTDIYGQNYLKKNFKIRKIDFVNFFSPILRHVGFKYYFNENKKYSWKNYGF